MLEVGLSRDYYVTRIQHIEQDIRDNEAGILVLYQKKADIIQEWAFCEEQLGTPVHTICAKIVNRLIELDCSRGIGHVYHSLESKYKNAEMSELGAVGGEHRWENSLTKVSGPFALPHEIQSLDTANADQMRDNEEFLREKMSELRRRHHEYSLKMLERGIPMRSDGDREPESTAHPYDPRKGHLYNAVEQCYHILTRYAETYKQIMENVEQFPPQTEEEDRELAQGLQYWAQFFEALYDYHRPFADEKFSQSYTKWFRTEILNANHGKHAAAVMSKVYTHLGEVRTLTREQVGDKLIDLYEKLVKFCGAMEMQRAIVESFPDEWHHKLMVPAIADRKNRVHPILSEGAFGSDRKK